MYILHLLHQQQACWTPKYVKSKEAQRRQNDPLAQHQGQPDSPSEALHRTNIASGAALLVPTLSPEEQVRLVFMLSVSFYFKISIGSCSRKLYTLHVSSFF